MIVDRSKIACQNLAINNCFRTIDMHDIAWMYGLYTLI